MEFESMLAQLKKLEQKSDAAWEQLHALFAQAHNAFDDNEEFDRIHEEIEVKQGEIDALAKEEESILAQMEQAA
jgi:hypothetical protein